MLNISSAMGWILLHLGGIALLSAVALPFIIALNIRGIRESFAERFSSIPGFRSNRRWKMMLGVFVYCFLVSFLLFGIGGAMIPDLEENENTTTDMSMSSTDAALNTPTIASSPTVRSGDLQQQNQTSKPPARNEPSTATATLSPTMSPTPTPSPTPTSAPTPEPTATPITHPKSVPDYRTARIDDVSYVNQDNDLIVRARVHIRVDDPCELSEEEYLRIGQDIAATATSQADFNAITVFSWGEFDSIGSESAYARVDWAPYGEWSRADDVETGEYQHHQYVFERLYKWDRWC